MKKARYRALTHRFLSFRSYIPASRRNEESPIQGIDTPRLYNHIPCKVLVEMKKARYRALTQTFADFFHLITVKVEMKKARYRALTPFFTSFKIEDSK